MDITRIAPVGDRVLVEPNPVEEEVGGVIVPKQAQAKSLTGKVIAIGNTVSKVVKEGDIVLYPEHAGTEIFGGHLLMPENQILCVIND